LGFGKEEKEVRGRETMGMIMQKCKSNNTDL
jgi:hypothetical protein